PLQVPGVAVEAREHAQDARVLGAHPARGLELGLGLGRLARRSGDLRELEVDLCPLRGPAPPVLLEQRREDAARAIELARAAQRAREREARLAVLRREGRHRL